MDSHPNPDTPDPIDQAKALAQEQALEIVRLWCLMRQQPPHPRLPEAVALVFEHMLRLAEAQDLPATGLSATTLSVRHLLAGTMDVSADLRAALEQVRRYAEEAAASSPHQDDLDPEDDCL